MSVARYHINSKGEPGVCKAQQACPFGDASEHYDSPEAAREAFEADAGVEHLHGLSREAEEDFGSLEGNYLTDETMDEMDAYYQRHGRSTSENWPEGEPFIPSEGEPPF